MKKERRALERLIPTRAMQVVFQGSRPVVGRIYNITTRGVSVEYDGSLAPRLDQDITIKLAMDMQSSLVVDEVLCKPVYDIPTLARDQTFRGSNMRLCGLEYARFKTNDRTMLDKLLAAAQ